MKDEYDFSNAERGRFFRSDASFNIPLYLDSDVESYFSAKAKAKGVALQVMVNDLLRKDISIINQVTK